MYRADTVKSQVIKVNINNGRQIDTIFSWSKNCTSPQWSFSPRHVTRLNNEKRITQTPAEAQSTITRSCILAWRIPLTVEPGRLQSIGLRPVVHYWSDLAHNKYLLVVWMLSFVNIFWSVLPIFPICCIFPIDV